MNDVIREAPGGPALTSLLSNIKIALFQTKCLFSVCQYVIRKRLAAEVYLDQRLY